MPFSFDKVVEPDLAVVGLDEGLQELLPPRWEDEVGKGVRVPVDVLDGLDAELDLLGECRASAEIRLERRGTHVRQSLSLRLNPNTTVGVRSRSSSDSSTSVLSSATVWLDCTRVPIGRCQNTAGESEGRKGYRCHRWLVVGWGSCNRRLQRLSHRFLGEQGEGGCSWD